MGATFSQNGINGLYTKITPDGITYTDERIAENVPVCVVISEDGLLWSPTALPLGKGELRATHGFSHVMYENAYNGCVSALKCYLARGKTAIVFDLTVENTANAARPDVVGIVHALVFHELYTCKSGESYVYGVDYE